MTKIQQTPAFTETQAVCQYIAFLLFLGDYEVILAGMSLFFIIVFSLCMLVAQDVGAIFAHLFPTDRTVRYQVFEREAVSCSACTDMLTVYFLLLIRIRFIKVRFLSESVGACDYTFFLLCFLV